MPFIVLGNKVDIPTAAPEDELKRCLGLSGLTTGKSKGDNTNQDVRSCRIDHSVVLNVCEL